MKNLLLLLILSAYLQISAQQTHVPDNNFEQALIDLGYDDVLDDYVLTTNINSINSLNVSDSCINDLTGIQDFKALTDLYCSDNLLTNLDVSQNMALIYLICQCNQLTNLDVSQNTALMALFCYSNELTNLDFSNNTSLTHLYCQNNELTNIDVSQNTALNHLYCCSNQLTNLDISNNTALAHLDCYSNQLTNLDVSHNTALTDLYCQNNELTNLDISNNTALAHLDCHSNQLTNLDISNNPALAHLDCYSNQLTYLDISNNPALTHLDCYSNQLIYLDISNNPALTHLDCYSNQLTYLDIRNGNNTNITNDDFNAFLNPNLTCIFVDDATWSASNWINIDPNSTFIETKAECEALGVDNEYLSQNIQIYPNPITDKLYINTNNNLSIQSIQLYDVLSKIVLEELHNFDHIDVSLLINGIYLVKIETDKGILTKKMLKEQ